MDTVTLPYKLQIWMSENLRDDLKDLARARGLTLQKLVITVLEHTVQEPPAYLHAERQRRTAPTA